MIDLFDLTAFNFDIGQLFALEFKEHLTRNLELDSVDLGVNQGKCGAQAPGVSDGLSCRSCHVFRYVEQLGSGRFAECCSGRFLRLSPNRCRRRIRACFCSFHFFFWYSRMPDSLSLGLGITLGNDAKGSASSTAAGSGDFLF